MHTARPAILHFRLFLSAALLLPFTPLPPASLGRALHGPFRLEALGVGYFFSSAISSSAHPAILHCFPRRGLALVSVCREARQPQPFAKRRQVGMKGHESRYLDSGAKSKLQLPEGGM